MRHLLHLIYSQDKVPFNHLMNTLTQPDWKTLIKAAWEKREPIRASGDTDSYRLFHGYQEGLNGVSIEKFGDVAIVDFKQDIRESLDELADALNVYHDYSLIIAKGHQSLGLKLRQRLFAVSGKIEDTPYFAEEYGVRYYLEPDAPHNAGLYVDARPVRQWLLNNSQDRRVLNLFSFAGSLGLAACKGGARSVTHLDKSAELLPRIEKSYEANGLTLDNRDFLRGDIYKHLPRAIRNGQRFDGIILDPPPKVYASRHAENKPLGQDFHQLAKLCSKLLNPGGWLIAMFHRFDSTWEDEERSVINASQNTLAVTERFNSGIDFPESDPNRKLRVSIFVKSA